MEFLIQKTSFPFPNLPSVLEVEVRSAFPCIVLCFYNYRLLLISAVLFGMQLNMTCAIIHKEPYIFKDLKSLIGAVL